MDGWWQRGEFEFDPNLSWWWGIQVTNCFLSLCNSAPTILQILGPMRPFYFSIHNIYVKSERGYCILICWWDKTLLVSPNSSPAVQNRLCKHMCKTEFYRVWKIACKYVHVSLIMKSLWKNWDRFFCRWVS